MEEDIGLFLGLLFSVLVLWSLIYYIYKRKKWNESVISISYSQVWVKLDCLCHILTGHYTSSFKGLEKMYTKEKISEAVMIWLGPSMSQGTLMGGIHELALLQSLSWSHLGRWLITWVPVDRYTSMVMKGKKMINHSNNQGLVEWFLIYPKSFTDSVGTSWNISRKYWMLRVWKLWPLQITNFKLESIKIAERGNPDYDCLEGWRKWSSEF